MPGMDQTISLLEFAARLGVGYSTAAHWCACGKLPATKRGGQWRIERGEVDARLRQKISAMREEIAELTQYADALDSPPMASNQGIPATEWVRQMRTPRLVP